MNDFDKRLHQIIANIFGVPIESITEKTSNRTVKGWDSFNIVNLVVALEEEFGVGVSPEDAAKMVSVEMIKRILKDRGCTD